jgi:hypothetical protein
VIASKVCYGIRNARTLDSGRFGSIGEPRLIHSGPKCDPNRCLAVSLRRERTVCCRFTPPPSSHMHKCTRRPLSCVHLLVDDGHGEGAGCSRAEKHSQRVGGVWVQCPLFLHFPGVRSEAAGGWRPPIKAPRTAHRLSNIATYSRLYRLVCNKKRRRFVDPSAPPSDCPFSSRPPDEQANYFEAQPRVFPPRPARARARRLHGHRCS